MRTTLTARIQLLILTLSLALCLAFAANAQTPRPPFPLAGTFTDQLLEEWNKCRSQNVALTDSLYQSRSQTRAIRDSLTRSRNLLATSRREWKTLDSMRLARLATTTSQGNTMIQAEYDGKRQALVLVADYEAASTYLYTALLKELARDTALGVGRKRWLRQAQQWIEEFRAKHGKP